MSGQTPHVQSKSQSKPKDSKHDHKHSKEPKKSDKAPAPKTDRTDRPERPVKERKEPKEPNPVPTPPPSGNVKQLVAEIMQKFQPALMQAIQSVDKAHFWLVVARLILNKEQLCDKECEEEMHFHDVDDWFGRDERRVLDKFWAKLGLKKPDVCVKGQKYVDDLVQFTKSNAAALVQLILTQTESTREFLETIINPDSHEFIESLLHDEEGEDILKSFAFYCAVVCTIMEYHRTSKDAKAQLETGWFEVFFQYLLDDLDDESDDEDESETDDDGEDGDDESEEETTKAKGAEKAKTKTSVEHRSKH